MDYEVFSESVPMTEINGKSFPSNPLVGQVHYIEAERWVYNEKSSIGKFWMRDGNWSGATDEQHGKAMEEMFSKFAKGEDEVA